MTSRLVGLPRGIPIAIAALVAVVLAWRIVVTGLDALREAGIVPRQNAAASPLAVESPDANLRERLARNPADYEALLKLSLQLEQDGNKQAARDAAAEALRLAPADQGILYQTAFLYLRTGDEKSGLAVLRRFVELYPDKTAGVWPVFSAALNSGPHAEFFARAARENPSWWPAFIQHACNNAAVGGLQQIYATRVRAGLAAVEERRCVIARLQREGLWPAAYQAWLNGLPTEQKQRVGFVYNGGFETPISNLGFDWNVPPQEGVVVNADLNGGASGKRALHVTFINKRYSGPPVYQYLMLFPGTYRFDGRGRADSLSSWLGLQWGLYCRDAKGGDARQLARSEPLVGSADWSYFSHDFTLGKDCPVQVLRLELANPQRDAKSAGSVAIRLRGGLWFDDLRVRSVD